MIMKKIRLVIISFLILTIFMTNSLATKVDVISGNLPYKLHEGEESDFTLKISGYNNVKSITIETSLTSSKPIYDFGELNPSIPENRYNSLITLDVSSLPKKEFQVHISGKAPEGETRINAGDSNIVISKFSTTKLNFYEVRTDKELSGIESFELIIKRNEDFDKTLEKISREELNGVKKEVENLFNNGLTTEAQNIADQLVDIKWPDSLTLFGFLKFNNGLLLSIIIIILLIICLIIGYAIGVRSCD